jgi:hypothetical protein
MADFLKATIDSIERVQKFPTSTLPRTEVLGTALGFSDAVVPAEKLIELFKKFQYQS